MTPHVRIRIAIPTLAPAAARHRARPPADDARTEGQTVGQRRVRGRVEGERQSSRQWCKHRRCRPPASLRTRLRPAARHCRHAPSDHHTEPRARCAAPSQRSPHATHAATIAADADPALLVGAGGSSALLPAAAAAAAAAAALLPRPRAPRRRAPPPPPPALPPPTPALPPGADGVSPAPHPASARRGSAARSARLCRTLPAASITFSPCITFLPESHID